MSEPTTSELMWRLDQVVARIDKLAQQLDEGYVRKDVQLANDNATALHVQSIEDGLHSLGKRFDAVTEQRNRERDERDAQRASDRRLTYTLAVSVFLGPIFVALLLHWLKA